MMSKEDQKLASETVEVEVGNVSTEHSMTVASPKGLGKLQSGVPVEGFGDLPMSIVSLPFCILVQEGTKVLDANGKRVEPGNFYWTDTKEVTKEIHIVSLRANVIQKPQLVDGKEVLKPKLRCLCANMMDTFSLGILSLPVTSFTGWGKMVNEMIKRGIKNSYEYEGIGTIKEAKNKKGNEFYIAEFTLGEALFEEDLAVMREQYSLYGGVLDRQDLVDEEEMVYATE